MLISSIEGTMQQVLGPIGAYLALAIWHSLQKILYIVSNVKLSTVLMLLVTSNILSS